MAKSILIIKNASIEGPCLIADFIKKRKIKYEIIDLEKGEELLDIKKYNALIVMGGPDSANDQSYKITKELKFIKGALDLGLPYLGICLGMQLLAKALGAKVVKNKVKEIGLRDFNDDFFTISLNQKGQKDDIFKGLGQNIKVLQWHQETVVLNKNLELLARGKFCKNQVIKAKNNAYGMQFHFELGYKDFQAWLHSNDAFNKEIDHKKALLDFKNLKLEYKNNGKKIVNNFLDLI